MVKFFRRGEKGEVSRIVRELLKEGRDTKYARVRRPIKPPNFKEVETYPLYDPWAWARILQNPDTNETIYWVDEIPLSETERRIYNKIMEILYWELKPPPSEEEGLEYFKEEAKRVVMEYRIRFGRTPGVSWSKILYYVERDIVGYGPIDPLMRDKFVEDISCSGVGRPVYVWHRRYEYIPTNIVFNSEKELDSLVVRLAHKAGKHISVAFPVVDAILPGGHRLAATFRKEVSTSGSTFTIRKFREDPITIIDMLEWGNISPELAAYLWLLIEHKKTGLILGVTGSGKTSTLNALATLFRPTVKVVTIEDTPELRLPLENWVQLVARPSYGIGPQKIGEITLYDLVKVSLRYRPDIIIVGEVRGEEAYVLFQAIASVSRDTPILLMDSRGDIMLVTIGEFVDSFYVGNEERVAKPVNGYYILSNEGFKVAWKPIKYVLRHRVDEIYEIEYEGGVIKATGTHSVFVLDPHTLNIITKPVKELRKGDLLITYLSRSRGGPLNEEHVSIIEDSLTNNNEYLDSPALTPENSFTSNDISLNSKDSALTTSNMMSGEPKVKNTDEFKLEVNSKFSNQELSELLNKIVRGGRKEGSLNILQAIRKPATVRSIINYLERTLEAPSSGCFRYVTKDKMTAYELTWLARMVGLYSEFRGDSNKGYVVSIGKCSGLLNRVPLEFIANLVREALPSHLKHLRLGKERFISKEEAKNVVELIMRKGRISDTASSMIKKLLEFIEGDLAIAEVKKITRRAYYDYVYDVSVPSTESFIGGAAPILLHNTGHGGLTTLHAENIDAAVKRLTSPPMNIPKSYVPLIDFALVIRRVTMYRPDGTHYISRKISNVWEVRDYGTYVTIGRWDPARDKFLIELEKSEVIKDIAAFRGVDTNWAIDEVYRRAIVLEWMRFKGIRYYRDIAKVVHKYYARPDEVYKNALRELERMRGVQSE